MIISVHASDNGDLVATVSCDLDGYYIIMENDKGGTVYEGPIPCLNIAEDRAENFVLGIL